jgi:predicted metalloprotease with PDZ domain
MTPRFVAVLAGLCLPMLAAAAPPAPVIRVALTVEPVVRAQDPYLRVEAAYRAAPGGACRLLVPSAWGGQENLMKAVRNLVVDGADGPLRETAQPNERVFPCKAGKPLRVRYELHQDFDGKVDNERRYRFVMEPDYFHFSGNAAWILPDIENVEPRLRIDLQWVHLPVGWRLANSFGVDRPRQHIDARSGAFVSGSFVGGDFRLLSRGKPGKVVTVAVRGKWPFTDAQYAEAAQATIAMERRFWRAPDAPFLVTLIPLAGSGSIGGTGLTDAFQTYGTADARFKDLEWLLAHEYFHTWNPFRLGGLEEPEQLRYWIGEGFTDYYASLLRLRAGRITLDEYVQSVNDLLTTVWMSPARNATNERVLQDFWKNNDVQKLPYYRGNLLALEWNAQIREASGGRQSFDEVVYALEKRAGGKSAPLTAERFDTVLAPFTGRSALPDIARVVDRGELIVPRAAWLGPGAVLEQVEMPTFELGIDRPALLQKKIAGVAADSAAYRAGLRDGQTVVRRKPYIYNKPDQVIEIVIADGEGEKAIRYEPKSSRTVAVPQFRLPAEGRAAAMQWLGAAAP